MSKNEKVVVAVVVVLVLAGLGYYWYQHSKPTATATFTTASTTLPTGSDTSDKSLQKDTAAIDAQLQGLSGDQATVNSSVTAQ